MTHTLALNRASVIGINREMKPDTQETPEAVKARGAFYTPSELTTFLARWAIRDKKERALEPSCGDGAFLAALTARFKELGRQSVVGYLDGIELEAGEAKKAEALAPGARIRVSSFFDVRAEDLPQVDAVIGNPPYIRYHGFTGNMRIQGLARASEQGVHLSNLASSWAPFLVHAAAFLPAAGGRIGLVLPAELLHTDYAAPVRAWLVRRFSSVVLITFDKPVFKDAQVDALILLASNDDQAGLRVLRAANPQQLAQLDVRHDPRTPRRAELKRWSGAIDAGAESVYLDLIATPGTRRLGDIASVDIGVVTGANKFFILSEAEVKRLQLPESVLTPILRTTSDAGGLQLRPTETQQLFLVPASPEPTSKRVLSYIAQGERDGVNSGYKCRNRKPWYRVPMPRVRPSAFMPYLNHHAPKLIVNRPRAWSTNLVHAVALKSAAPDIRALAGAMLSSATMLSAEIEGRAYGGGVLKFETKEAERLVIPAMTSTQERDLVGVFGLLDKLVRAGKTDEASARVDKILGLDRARYLAAYQIFRKRRLERR